MDFEDLPAFWQARSGTSGASASVQFEQVVARSRQLDAQVRRRDRLETWVALAIAPIFAIIAVVDSHPVSRLGAAILALSCLAIPLRLARARRGFRAARRDLSLHDFLREERDRVLAQRHLLLTVLWWYLLPLGVGVVMLFGGKQSVGATMGYAAVVIVVYGGLYLLSQRAVAKELEPRLEEIDALRSAAEELEQGAGSSLPPGGTSPSGVER